MCLVDIKRISSTILAAISYTMGRRKIEWSEEIEMEFLVCLGLAVNRVYRETGKIGSIEDVIRQLESELLKSELLELKLAQDQIDETLKRLWKDANSNADPWENYTYICHYGIRSFTDLDSSVKDHIAQEVEIREKNEELKEKFTPRRTRNESRQVSSELSHSRGGRTASTELTPTKSKRQARGQNPQDYPSKRSKTESKQSRVCEWQF
jgi:hypothetical protein